MNTPTKKCTECGRMIPIKASECPYCENDSFIQDATTGIIAEEIFENLLSSNDDLSPNSSDDNDYSGGGGDFGGGGIGGDF